MKISILLATYNSSSYIREQILSLINQSYQDWNLFIRDDGSSDNTISILKEFEDCDSRIHLIEPDGMKLGAAKGFMWLMENVESEYYMFCDHDDVWLPEKIEKSLNKMRDCESSFKGPVLVHSDLLVVDENLDIIHSSYWNSVGIKPSIIKKGQMIQVFNCVTGCTMLFNKKVREISLPYHERAPMHDWWIAIRTIMNNGIIEQVPEPLIKYRQHGKNEVGAKAVDLNYYMKKFKNFQDTFAENTKKIGFLKEIGGIGLLKYLYYKLYYNIVRKF